MSRLDELIEMRRVIDRAIDLEQRQLLSIGQLRDDVAEVLAKWSAPTRDTLRAAATEFGVPVVAILDKSRHIEASNARHVAAWLLRDQGLSYPTIGSMLGGRDHTTAMNSCRRVATSPMLGRAAAAVKARLVGARHDDVEDARLAGPVAVASVHHVKGQ